MLITWWLNERKRPVQVAEKESLKFNHLFRPVQAADGSIKLEENIFSWSRIANVLYIESPRGVGYSYSERNQDQVYNDTQTALDNMATIVAFLDMFREYGGRPFYITGESYGGVYVPTLVDTILTAKDNGRLTNLNFKGFAVGNGILSGPQQINSAVHLVCTKKRQL
jgi:cathepsin A (carboxypeptidase C)